MAEDAVCKLDPLRSIWRVFCEDSRRRQADSPKPQNQGALRRQVAPRRFGETGTIRLGSASEARGGQCRCARVGEPLARADGIGPFGEASDQDLLRGALGRLAQKLGWSWRSKTASKEGEENHLQRSEMAISYRANVGGNEDF